MHYSHYIGVDISKNTLDAAIYAAEMRRSDTKHLTNDAEGLKELVLWAKASGAKPKSMLICAEHTGVYGNALQLFCEKKGIALCLENPLQIKRSMGLVRGKDDQIDAIRIAQYAFDHRDKLKLYQRPSDNIQHLSNLLRERRLYVRQKAALLLQQSELGVYETAQSRTRRENLICKHDSAIKAVEKQMMKIIKSDAGLKKTYDLILSVVGIGLVTAIETIVYTNNFQNFETPRQYASFIGVAPFDHKSGVSVNGRTRVSQFCRKQQKVSITMAARSAIINDPWLKSYYHRKMKEKGDQRSQHGVILNAVKFKLILRMFAVVKSGTPYKVMKY
jgi:transposase